MENKVETDVDTPPMTAPPNPVSVPIPASTAPAAAEQPTEPPKATKRDAENAAAPRKNGSGPLPNEGNPPPPPPGGPPDASQPSDRSKDDEEGFKDVPVAPIPVGKSNVKWQAGSFALTDECKKFVPPESMEHLADKPGLHQFIQQLRRVVVISGAPDTGRRVAARWLANRLLEGLKESRLASAIEILTADSGTAQEALRDLLDRTSSETQIFVVDEDENQPLTGRQFDSERIAALNSTLGNSFLIVIRTDKEGQIPNPDAYNLLTANINLRQVVEKWFEHGERTSQPAIMKMMQNHTCDRIRELWPDLAFDSAPQVVAFLNAAGNLSDRNPKDGASREALLELAYKVLVVGSAHDWYNNLDSDARVMALLVCTLPLDKSRIERCFMSINPEFVPFAPIYEKAHLRTYGGRLRFANHADQVEVKKGFLSDYRILWKLIKPIHEEIKERLDGDSDPARCLELGEILGRIYWPQLDILSGHLDQVIRYAGEAPEARLNAAMLVGRMLATVSLHTPDTREWSLARLKSLIENTPVVDSLKGIVSQRITRLCIASIAITEMLTAQSVENTANELMDALRQVYSGVGEVFSVLRQSDQFGHAEFLEARILIPPYLLAATRTLLQVEPRACQELLLKMCFARRLRERALAHQAMRAFLAMAKGDENDANSLLNDATRKSMANSQERFIESLARKVADSMIPDGVPSLSILHELMRLMPVVFGDNYATEVSPLRRVFSWVEQSNDPRIHDEIREGLRWACDLPIGQRRHLLQDLIENWLNHRNSTIRSIAADTLTYLHALDGAIAGVGSDDALLLLDTSRDVEDRSLKAVIAATAAMAVQTDVDWAPLEAEPPQAKQLPEYSLSDVQKLRYKPANYAKWANWIKTNGRAKRFGGILAWSYASEASLIRAAIGTEVKLTPGEMLSVPDPRRSAPPPPKVPPAVEQFATILDAANQAMWRSIGSMNGDQWWQALLERGIVDDGPSREHACIAAIESILLDKQRLPDVEDLRKLLALALAMRVIAPGLLNQWLQRRLKKGRPWKNNVRSRRWWIARIMTAALIKAAEFDRVMAEPLVRLSHCLAWAPARAPLLNIVSMIEAWVGDKSPVSSAAKADIRRTLHAICTKLKFDRKATGLLETRLWKMTQPKAGKGVASPDARATGMWALIDSAREKTANHDLARDRGRSALAVTPKPRWIVLVLCVDPANPGLARRHSDQVARWFKRNSEAHSQPGHAVILYLAGRNKPVAVDGESISSDRIIEILQREDTHTRKLPDVFNWFNPEFCRLMLVVGDLSVDDSSLEEVKRQVGKDRVRVFTNPHRPVPDGLLQELLSALK